MQITITEAIWMYVISTFLAVIFDVMMIKFSTGDARTIGLILLVKSLSLLTVVSLFFTNPLRLLYTDWIITTPLTLLTLALYAMMRKSKHKMLIFGLVVTDLIMITLGWISAYAPPATKWWWFGMAILPMFVILYLLYKPLSRIAKQQPAEINNRYRFLISFTALTWGVFPLIWVLGHFENGGLSMESLLTIFNVMNALTKTTYIYWIFRSLKGISWNREVGGDSPELV